jgi:hypothetical protein
LPAPPIWAAAQVYFLIIKIETFGVPNTSGEKRSSSRTAFQDVERDRNIMLGADGLMARCIGTGEKTLFYSKLDRCILGPSLLGAGASEKTKFAGLFWCGEVGGFFAFARAI